MRNKIIATIAVGGFVLILIYSYLGLDSIQAEALQSEKTDAVLELTSQRISQERHVVSQERLEGSESSSSAEQAVARIESLTSPMAVAYSFGVPVREDQSLEDYFVEAMSQWESGRFENAPHLARLISGCRTILRAANETLLDSDQHWAKKSEVHCKFLADLKVVDPSEILSIAALSGSKEAIFLEWSYPPPTVVASPSSDQSKIWAETALLRLNSVASRGDSQALFMFGVESVRGRFGVVDYPSGARALSRYIAQAGFRDDRRNLAVQYLTRACGAIEEAEWNSRCRQL